MIILETCLHFTPFCYAVIHNPRDPNEASHTWGRPLLLLCEATLFGPKPDEIGYHVYIKRVMPVGEPLLLVSKNLLYSADTFRNYQRRNCYKNTRENCQNFESAVFLMYVRVCWNVQEDPLYYRIEGRLFYQNPLSVNLVECLLPHFSTKLIPVVDNYVFLELGNQLLA